MAVFRLMVVDEDGRRVGRYETSEPDWRSGDRFEIDGAVWRIVEVLPEVSTMVAYNAVWVAAPIDVDEPAEPTLPVSVHPGAIR